LKEAANYREDILEVMRRTRQSDPSLPPYPERLYKPKDWGDSITGPLALVDTGFLNPSDPAFVQLEGYMKKNYNRGILGLTGSLSEDGDEHGQDSYYVIMSDTTWQRAWILRGEIEKALLTFYSALAFGVDKQTLGAVERFDLYDQRYAPYYWNGDGSSQITAMIRQTLLLEQDKVLYLLGGPPDVGSKPAKQLRSRTA
jgi:hypothetical protein